MSIDRISRIRRAARNRRGQSLAELAAGLMVFVPIILLLCDCAVIVIGVAQNDTACRDAARAASSGPPGAMLPGTRTVTSGQAPYRRAKSVIKEIYALGGLIKISETMAIKETVRAPLPEAPHGGPILGEVSVQTTAEVSPPFLIGAIVQSGSLQFKNTQKYPYTYVMPSSGG